MKTTKATSDIGQEGKDEVIVVPRLGLANRMRAVISSKIMADSLDRKLRVMWRETEDNNCSFDELFEPTVELVDAGYMTGKDYVKYNDAAIRDAKNIIRGAQDIEQNQGILLETCFEFRLDGIDFTEYKRRFTQELNGLFIPNSDIRSRLVMMPKNTVGVHIRRGDNSNSIEFSTDKDFMNEMDTILEEDPDTYFFVATDSKETKDTFRARYGAKIITRDIDYERDNSSGIKDALVDILQLSQTRMILGSYWSSFSDIAARYNNIPLRKVGTTNERDIDTNELSKQAKKERDEGDLGQSIKHYTALMKKEPDNMHHHYFGGTAYMYKGDQICNARPEDKESYINYFVNAMHCFRRTLEINPGHTSAQECLNKVLTKLSE